MFFDVVEDNKRGTRPLDRPYLHLLFRNLRAGERPVVLSDKFEDQKKQPKPSEL